MSNMEFLKQNKYETTTSIKVDSNTGTVDYLMDRRLSLGYASSGYNSTTSTIISIEFGTPVVLSHVLIQNHNLKQFRGFYNSSTANSLFTTTQNSATSSYYSFASVTVSSIQLQMDDTIQGSVEKSVGEFVVSERRLQFERNPSAGNFQPKKSLTRIFHDMPDGGVTAFVISPKFKADLSWRFVSNSMGSILQTVYEEAKPLYFLPYPTTSAWDGQACECLWTNDFDFVYGENSKTQGQNGSIVLRETASA